MKKRILKFRLIKDNKIVGYELFQNEDKRMPFGCKWLYSKNNFRWDGRFIKHDTKNQYTGLKDKNGKEIYGEDIVKIKYREYVGKVVWNIRGCWISEGIYTKEGYSLNITSADEVIGNIYENSNLLIY